MLLDNLAYSVSEGTFLCIRLDEKKAVKSRSWQRYIRNDPLMYHGGYKFGATQVLAKLNQQQTTGARMQVLIDGTEWTLRHLGDLRQSLTFVFV